MAMEVLQADLPAVAAAAGTSTFEVGEVPPHESQGNFNVERIAITSPTLVTGATATAGTFTVRQMRAGSSVATLATLALVTGTNLAADVPTALTVSGTPTVNAGDVIDVQYVQISTGTALPAGVNIAVEID